MYVSFHMEWGGGRVCVLGVWGIVKGCVYVIGESGCVVESELRWAGGDVPLFSALGAVEGDQDLASALV